MNNPFNPFSPVLEDNKLNPHARSLRSSFWQKINDTWRVLVGNWSVIVNNEEDRDVEAGLLDYMGLGLVRICIGILLVPASLLFVVAGTQKNMLHALAIILAVPAMALWLTEVLIRYPLGLALTIALSPLVLMIHAVTQLIHYSIDQAIQHEISELEKNDPEGKKDSYQSLYKTLNEPNIHIGVKGPRDLCGGGHYDGQHYCTFKIVDNNNGLRPDIDIKLDSMRKDRFFKLICTLNPHEIGKKIDEQIETFEAFDKHLHRSFK